MLLLNFSMIFLHFFFALFFKFLNFVLDQSLHIDCCIDNGVNIQASKLNFLAIKIFIKFQKNEIITSCSLKT
jgi:hypothetical protein